MNYDWLPGPQNAVELLPNFDGYAYDGEGRILGYWTNCFEWKPDPTWRPADRDGGSR